jgi:hypothetical protein
MRYLGLIWMNVWRRRISYYLHAAVDLHRISNSLAL